MRIISCFAISAALGSVLAVSATGSVATHRMSKPILQAASWIAKGKALSSAKHCNSCHAADLKGKPGFSPSLLSNGVLKEYNAATWARVLDTGVTNDGGKVKPPMPIYHLAKADSKALYAYFKSIK